jgi:V-type H+-transporting ATPase subunit E
MKHQISPLQSNIETRYFFLNSFSAQSNHINKARLRILQERQQVLDDLFQDTDNLIHEVSKDEDKYATLMEGLILQGAYALMENDVVIKCREEDIDQVNSAKERAAEKYEEHMKTKPTFEISDEFLPASR